MIAYSIESNIVFQERVIYYLIIVPKDVTLFFQNYSRKQELENNWETFCQHKIQKKEL